ncbi:hypothetical protein [Saccharothrix lopnurensis]|uniref:Subtilisin inhibitor-like n=1 Tax=Saccharothrix lopnurensis TaxID=1670621 RepID=A0ABW1P6D6_9PSEU
MSRSVRLVMAALLALGALTGWTTTAMAADERDGITVPLTPNAPSSGRAESRALYCTYTYTPGTYAVASARCYHTGPLPSRGYTLGAMCGDGSTVYGEPTMYGSPGSVSCPGYTGIRRLSLVPMY